MPRCEISMKLQGPSHRPFPPWISRNVKFLRCLTNVSPLEWLERPSGALQVQICISPRRCRGHRRDNRRRSPTSMSMTHGPVVDCSFGASIHPSLSPTPLCHHGAFPFWVLAWGFPVMEVPLGGGGCGGAGVGAVGLLGGSGVVEHGLRRDGRRSGPFPQRRAKSTSFVVADGRGRRGGKREKWGRTTRPPQLGRGWGHHVPRTDRSQEGGKNMHDLPLQ